MGKRRDATPELDEKDEDLMATLTAIIFVCKSQSFQFSSKPAECLEASVQEARDVVLRIKAYDWVT